MKYRMAKIAARGLAALLVAVPALGGGSSGPAPTFALPARSGNTVSLAQPDSKAAESWLQQTPVSFPVLFDTESKVSKMYNVSGMPTSVFIDKKGNLREVHQSYKPGDENEYLNQIRALMRE